MHPSAVLYDYAMSWNGVEYRYGGDDPLDGVDCSGLVIDILQAAGVLPRGFDANADGLWKMAAWEKTTEPRFGSLVYFGTPALATHVGFCLNEFHMLEAGGGDGTTLSRAQAAKQNAFVRVRPIKWRKDLLGFRHPTYAWKV